MQAVSGCVFPKDGVGAVDGGSSESLPTGVDAFMDLSAANGDSDGATAVDGDGIEASTCVFLEGDVASGVECGIVSTDLAIAV